MLGEAVPAQSPSWQLLSLVSVSLGTLPMSPFAPGLGSSQSCFIASVWHLALGTLLRGGN